MNMKLYTTLWKSEILSQTENEVVLTEESAEPRAVEMEVINI